MKKDTVSMFVKSTGIAVAQPRKKNEAVQVTLHFGASSPKMDVRTIRA